MKITNKLHLPHPILNYARRNPYKMGKADYSATTLIDSPRVSTLRTRHREEISEDISEMIMSLLGTAVHSILEEGARDEDMVEKRFFADFGGKTITGQIDLMTPNPDETQRGYIICDYKTTSAHAISRNPEGKDSWQQQLNIYAALARKNGFKVSGVEVIAVIRDWSKRASERSATYPRSAIVRIPVDMWDEEDAIRFIESRVTAHEGSKNILHECSEEERWLSPTVWAVHKRIGNQESKRASKLFDDEGEAREFADQNTESARRKGGREVPEYIVIKRIGESVRCESFCSVSSWCEQWEKIKESENEQ